MSLINKLLQDLEKREAHFEEPPDSVLDGLYSAYDVEGQPVPRRSIAFIIVGLLILVSAVIAALIMNSLSVVHQQKSDSDTGTIGHVVNSDSRENDRPDNSTAASTSFVTESVRKDKAAIAGDMRVHSPGEMNLRLDQGLTSQPAEFIPAGISTVTQEMSESLSTSTVLMERNQDGLLIRFQLPEKVPYQVYTLESPYRTVFEFDNTRLHDDLPDFSNIENIIAVRKHRDKNGQSRFVIESSVPYVIDQSIMQQHGNQYALQVRLLTADTDLPAGKKSAAASMDKELLVDPDYRVQSSQPKTVLKGDIVKTERKPVTVSEADKLLYEAERLYRRGKIAKALDRLYAAVESDPRHRVARTTLALRLSEQQQSDLAVSILEEGLAVIPDMPDWALVLAQIHMQAGRLAEAENVLSGVIPPVADNPDYHALYAAVLQKQEKHRMAAETYQKLLQVNPENGIWWMGLAISLEAISMSSDARFAYRNALAVKSLTPETQQYIIERIRILDQQIGNEPS